jgi:16S rRNA A1518/A1519 N6-dimethyltransferase RsmA/KsgA/DIM1 with predicted DNA glycosylase/AP lyase activity
VSADGSNIIYYYNPCYTFTENESSSDSCTPSKDIAVCQVDGNIPYNVGRQLTATFHESPVSMTGFSVMISAMAFAKLEL